MVKHFLTAILLCLFLLPAAKGQQTIIAPESRISSTFAIFIDSDSYEHCKDAVIKYRDMLEKEGLPAYILAADWESPEHVKFFLEKYYYEQALEGAVFIGDIPIPMVRRAQHLTSAFKMDESAPMHDSSVPSDRFYDDFNLKFNFICRDTVNTNLFYYNLAGDGPQKIHCNIYTGRIKPTREGEEGYRQINDYLNKVVAERQNVNYLDKVASYAGHGSFSNSLSAWKDESVTLREQMPDCFKGADGARFYMFYMYPYMKETLIDEVQREDLDIMFFHEHGDTRRQYLTGTPDATYDDAFFELAKYNIRSYLRRMKDWGEDVEEAKSKMMERYGIDSLWFEGAFDKEVMAKDSLEDLKTGIIVEEIPQIAPNVRLTIFDACYNGDFRERSFIAGEYIFAGGKSIVCIGNSVNVLQDKSSSDLLGLLACGFRVGTWAQLTNILESHIIGDPTFRFAPTRKLPAIKMNLKDTSYWLAVLQHNLPVDIKGLALYKLFDLEYENMSDLLLQTYKSSDSYMLRLQCLHLLAYYNDSNYSTLLKLAVSDPYEFIRRKAAYFMGKVGRNDFVPYLNRLYLDDYLSERVAFNVLRSGGLLNTGLLKADMEKRVEQTDYIYDKEKFLKTYVGAIENNRDMADFVLERLLDKEKSAKSRLSYISSARNNPAASMVSDMLDIIKDESEPVELKVGVTEALGWYVYSERKGEIIAACEQILGSGETLAPEFEDELQKTINRLKVYMR